MNNPINPYLQSELFNYFTGAREYRIQNITPVNARYIFMANLVGYLYHNPNFIRFTRYKCEVNNMKKLLNALIDGEILMYDNNKNVETGPFMLLTSALFLNFRKNIC